MVPAQREQHERFLAARQRMWQAGQRPKLKPKPVVRVIDFHEMERAREERRREAERQVIAAVVAAYPQPKPAVARDILYLSTRGSVLRFAEIVAYASGVPRQDILSERRGSGACFARQIAMWLARYYSHRSLPKIGRAYKRDHTTVLHAVRKLNAIAQRIGPSPVNSPEAWAAHLWGACHG